MCDWVEANPVPWEGTMLDRERITEHSSNLIDVFRLIYEARMKADKAAIWCCKSTFNLRYIHDLETQLQPFYIYLYRDGRDVASSFKKTIVGPKHTFHLAKKWSTEQKAVLRFLNTISDKRYFSISYEELLSDPEKIMRSLCSKIGVPFQSDMLQFYASRESALTAGSGEMWKNVLRPVMKNNSGKYLTELTSSDIALFESVAGIQLKQLGYGLNTEGDLEYEGLINQYDTINQQMQLKAQLNASEKDKLKRARQQELLRSIHNRFGLRDVQAI